MLKKSTKVITSIIFIFLLFLSANVEASTFNDNQVVDKNKNWTIEFNQEVLFESAQEGIKVIDSKGKDVDISLDFGQDEKTIIVNPPMGGYIEGESYTLIIDSNVKSKSGKLLKEKIEFRFNIKNKEDNIEENDEVMIIKESMSIDEPVNKTIIIPEDINDIIVDFNGQQVKELIVKGDRNTIKNATIVKLNIEETVDNLYLENISDTDGSEHIFNGGGGHSIKLQGNTTFKGKVKITSGVDIQIKAESEDAKIEGTVSVESSAKTIISAPVSNLVVDTENSQVVINAKVDKVAVRNDATITVNKGIDAPTIEARIGTTVTAIDEEGEEVEVAVEYALDTYELDLNISEAKYRIENVLEGPYDGNVAEGEKEKLSIALDEAQRALEDKEATKENQENIDRAAKELESAIKEFDSKKIRVDKWELNQLIHDVDIFLNHSGIVIGEDIGNYPEESYDEFKEAFDEIREYLNGNKVTQDGVDMRLKELQDAFQEFKSSKITTSETEGIARFIISGDNIDDWYVETREAARKRKDGDYWSRIDNIGEDSMEVKKEEGQININIKFDEIHNYEEFVIIVRLNNYEYLAFLRITSEEIENGEVKEILLDDFASIDVSIEGETVEHLGHNSMYLLDENEKYICGTWASKDYKIQPGKYSICSIVKKTDIPYYAYTPVIDLDGGDKEFQFKQEDFVKVELKLNQIHPYNYTIKSVALSKYGVTTVSNIDNENPVFYLSKGEYDHISSDYIIDIEGNKYRFGISKKDIYINQDMVIECSDDFKLINSRYSENTDVVTIDDKQQWLGKFNIINDLGQRTSRFDKIDEDGHYDYSYKNKYLIKIVSEDKEYTKEVFGIYELSWITFEDVIGGEALEGEFTLEISMPEIPIVKPYIQKMMFRH